MTEQDRWFQTVMDWWKTVYDFYKHLMTLALVSIGTVGALVGGPFKSVVQLEKPQAALVPKALVVVIIGAFTIAALMSVVGMHSARQKNVAHEGQHGDGWSQYAQIE